MIKTTLRGLWSHKRRLISTCIAVILGVAFMAGTFVLTSTINRVFDDLFATGYDGIDAVVRGPVLFKDAQQGGTQRDRFDQSALDKVRAVPGVEAAAGNIGTQIFTVLDARKEPMGGNGPPTIVSSWVSDPKLNSYNVVDGRAPRANGEAVIDKGAFETGKFKLNGPIRIVTPQGTKTLKIVGVIKFGSADSSGGVLDVKTTLPQIQALMNEPGKLLEINARAKPGTNPQQLVDAIKSAQVAPKVSVVTGDQAAAEQSQELKGGFVNFFSTILKIFAFIALFVGGFIISNTFGILVAQRTKELALLRAIGATRRQVLGSVMLESAIIGVFSAVVGLVAGVLLAKGALTALNAVGVSLPSAGIVLEPSKAVQTILIGLFVTSVASFLPAVRATRVPPIAALRDVAVDNSGRSKIRAGFGFVALVLGILSVLPAFGADPKTSQLPGVGMGIALVIISVLVLGPTFAKPLSLVVGSPLPAIKGITGRLSRENAMRSPRRTASTASALIIGVTLIVFITAFAASSQTSISNSISGGFKGDYIVQPRNQGGFVGVSPKLSEKLAKVDGVEVVTAASFTGAQMTLPNGSKPGGFVGGIDPATYAQVFQVKMKTGRLADIVAGSIAVDRQIAEKHHIRLGQTIKVLSASGRRGSYKVSAISDEPNLLGQFTLLKSDAAKLNAEPADSFVGLKLRSGRSVESMRSSLEKVTDKYPTMKLQDAEQFTGSIVKQIKQVLNVIYGLLAVSVVIALIGIANTLSLSIHERTRELGLLRAMGMTRGQLRTMVRWEAAIVALMGTAIGCLLGVGASIVLVKALKPQGITDFSMPLVGGLSLLTIVIVSVGLGVAASLNPARRAAKLNVLEAIATD